MFSVRKEKDFVKSFIDTFISEDGNCLMLCLKKHSELISTTRTMERCVLKYHIV